MAGPDDTYTHGHSDAVLRSHRWRTAANSAAYLLPSLRPGLRLLDVGCGPGTLTVDLARRVVPAEVVGVDVGSRAHRRGRQRGAFARRPLRLGALSWRRSSRLPGRSSVGGDQR